jgi:hypothetical protein
MIAETLASYSAACDRANIDRRPTVWADHFNIWNEECGEIGLVTPDDGQANGAFAALIPFVLVPEIGTSILVLDLSGWKHRELAIIELMVVKSETEIHHCRVPFGVDDNGTMDFGNVKDEGSPYVSAQILAAVGRIADGRRERFAWNEEFSFELSVRVAAEFIRQLASV